MDLAQDGRKSGLYFSQYQEDMDLKIYKPSLSQCYLLFLLYNCVVDENNKLFSLRLK